MLKSTDQEEDDMGRRRKKRTYRSFNIMDSCIHKRRSPLPEIWQAHITDLDYCKMTDLCLIVSDSTSQSSWCPVMVHQSILLPVCSLLGSLIKARSLKESIPTIILADVTLSTLQCLLTIIYTGKCILSCDDSDLQLLMQSLGFSESLEIQSKDEVIDGAATENMGRDRYIPHQLVSGSGPCSLQLQPPVVDNHTGSLGLEQDGGNQAEKEFDIPEMFQVVPLPLRSISDLNTSLSLTNGKCDEISVKKCDVKIQKMNCDKKFLALALKEQHVKFVIYEDGLNYESSDVSVMDEPLVRGKLSKDEVVTDDSKADSAKKILKFGQNANVLNTCLVCAQILESKTSLKMHINKVHGEAKIDLNHGHNNAFKSKLKHHQKEDRPLQEVKLLKCDSVGCGKSFIKSWSLSRHKSSAHGGVKFECPICGKSFSQSSHLSTHKKSTHEGVKYECPDCGKMFGLKCNMAVHYNTVHTKEKQFKCTKCGLKFGQPQALKKHINTVHDKMRAFKCKHCDKSFGQKVEMKAHIECVHYKIRYPCNWPNCTHQAFTKSWLKYHISHAHNSCS